jgi:arylsulfatase A-like enzyme
VHFSVPHFPFVFDAGGFNPPFDPLRTSPDTAYARQVGYVDRLFGSLMQHMHAEGTYDGTTIVVLADHGFRFGGAEKNSRQIPFIVKRAGQRTREDVSTPMAGELLLKQVLQTSCGR